MSFHMTNTLMVMVVLGIAAAVLGVIITTPEMVIPLLK